MIADDKLRIQANVAFRFVVEIGGERQAAFTECSLPSIEWEVEEVKEGGLNTYVHHLPGRRKSAKVSLKNGVAKSELFQWYVSTMGEEFSRKVISISLLDSEQKDVIVWQIKDAYPVKWTGPQLKSDASAMAIQTLELACGEITVS